MWTYLAAGNKTCDKGTPDVYLSVSIFKIRIEVPVIFRDIDFFRILFL